MQIIKWLFGVSQEQPSTAQRILRGGKKKMLRFEEEEDDEVAAKEAGYEGIKLKKVDAVACKDSFTVLLSRVNSRTCLFTTLKFKNIRSSFYVRRDQYCDPHPAQEEDEEEEQGMGHILAEPAHVGSKVLPLICDSASQGADYSSDGSLNRKKRGLSRMKELMRWAAAAKADKGVIRKWKVLYFRNKGHSLKASPSEEKSTSSSKISFRWDVGSCSTSSSAFSPLSLASSSSARVGALSSKRRNSEDDPCGIKESCTSPKGDDYVRTGHWITTDSEFVVLEL